jgi:hypothetical protein
LENKREGQVLPGSEGGRGGWKVGRRWEVCRRQRGEVAQTMYTDMNKCKNNNKKETHQVIKKILRLIQ